MFRKESYNRHTHVFCEINSASVRIPTDTWNKYHNNGFNMKCWISKLELCQDSLRWAQKSRRNPQGLLGRQMRNICPVFPEKFDWRCFHLCLASFQHEFLSRGQFLSPILVQSQPQPVTKLWLQQTARLVDILPKTSNHSFQATHP